MKKLFTLIVIPILSIGLILSCEKDNDPYDFIVKVTINDTTAAQGALVNIYTPFTDTEIDYYLYTDENGETEKVTLKNKAVVEIFAGRGEYKGCGVAEINRGAQTVRIDMKKIGTTNDGCE